MRPIFMLGAGFSAPFGVPTMRPLYEGFVSYAPVRYNSLEASLSAIVADLDEKADIEALMSALGEISTADAHVPEGIDAARMHQWAEDARNLQFHLLSYVVEQCERFERERATELCGQLLTRVAERYGVILTTNYDRVVEYVAERTGVSIADGFGTTDVVSPWSGDFSGPLALLKLHGSVTWYGTADDPQEFLRLDRGYALPGPEFRLSRSGVELESLMIVPTLEKNALRQPYSHLLMRFNDLLADAKLVVIVGSSLRDESLVSALTYRASQLVALVVGRSAGTASRRLKGMRVAALDASTEQFLTVSQQELFEMVDSIADSTSPDDVLSMTEQFAATQTTAVARWSTLNDQERAALGALKSPEFGERLAALSSLRGSEPHPDIENTVLPLLSDAMPEVRSSSVSLLGKFKSSGAIDALRSSAIGDASPGVRLEASLALQRIGTAEAKAALDLRRRERDDDEFIESALRDTATNRSGATEP